RRNDLNAESSGLDHCSSCKVGAGESTWKPEIVLDATRHAGLPTGSFALDHDCSQSLTRAIDRRRQSRWTTADDREIVERFCGGSLESGVFGQIRERRLSQAHAVGKNHDR